MSLAARVLVVALAVGGAAVADSPSPAPSPEPVPITDAMRAAATFDLEPDVATSDLSAAESTWDLRPDDSTTSLETVVEEDEATTVRLTSDLLFRFGEHQVTTTAAAAVRDLVDDIPQGATVTVDGHTDSIGDDAFNRRLSGRRAEAVAAVLDDARPDLRLKVAGHGEQQPIAKNQIDGKDNPQGRAANRRVEIGYDSPAD